MELKEYTRKPESVQAMQLDETMQIKVGGTVLTGKKGDWFVAVESSGNIFFVDDTTFKKEYEPVP